MKYLTDYGKQCKEIVAKYSNLYDYYDFMSGNIIIPREIFDESSEVREEVFSLLSEQSFLDPDRDLVNWALEVFDTGDEDEKYVSVRIVKSFC